MSSSRSRLANAAHAAMLQRSELQRSLGLTTTALKPKSLKQRGKYHVTTTAREVADIAREEVQDKRVLFSIAAIAAGTAAWAYRKPLQEKGPAWLKSAGLRIGGFAASINRALDPGASDDDYTDLDRLKAKAASKRQQAQSAIQKLWPAALAARASVHEDLEDKMKPLSETAHDAREKASELAEKAAESARQTAEAAKARVQDGYGRARDVSADLAAKGREKADHAKDVASAAFDKSKAKAQVAGSRLREFADEQPLTLLAGALAAGLLVGSLLGSKSDDDIK